MPENWTDELVWRLAWGMRPAVEEIAKLIGDKPHTHWIDHTGDRPRALLLADHVLYVVNGERDPELQPTQQNPRPSANVFCSYQAAVITLHARFTVSAEVEVRSPAGWQGQPAPVEVQRTTWVFRDIGPLDEFELVRTSEHIHGSLDPADFAESLIRSIIRAR